MGMVKEKYIDHLEQKYGQKSFQDSEGNWVEMKTAKQSNLLDDSVEIIPHEVQC